MSFQYDPFSQNNNEDKQESTAKKAIKTATKAGKQKIKAKAARKLAKLAAQALKRGIVVLTKALITLLGTLGLPALIILGCMVFLIIIITFVSSSLFGSGIDLEGDEKKLYDHIVKESDRTVNLDNPEQSPYKVPAQLLSSLVQLDALKDDDHFKIVTDMADTLTPNFIYSDEFNEWTETQTRSCKEGEDCEAWSDIKRKDNYVTKLTNVDYWQGQVNFSFTPYTTSWKQTVEVETIIEKEWVEETYIDEITGEEKTREVKVDVEKKVRHYTKTRNQIYSRSRVILYDYTFLDTKLNSLGFGINDKRLLESNYNFQDNNMQYIAWLEEEYGGKEGGGYLPPYNPYPGLITPGKGIPSEFMPYYLAAEAAFGTPWYILASVHAQETQFSTHPTMISSAGAEGHMQVRP